MRAELQQQREELEGRIRQLQGEVADIVDATADVATDDEHDPEGATIAFERARVSALLDQSRAHLDDVDDALRRLNDGGYGRCVTCGDDIGAERLEALPSTRTCITCARTP
jgi:DnaK suppressor protein